MDRSFLILYLIYGVVYILMGFIALSSSRLSQKFVFFKYLRYLSAFAIIHGVSELLTVIVISDLFNDYMMFLYVLKRVLKALSFIYLLKFALCIYINKKSSIIHKIPEAIFLLWGIALTYLMINNASIEVLAVFFKVSIRYSMALPMGLFLAFILYKNRNRYQEISGLDRILTYLSFLFLIYAIVDGLFVRADVFFPANIINNEVFMDIFKFPIQYLKIGIGIVGCILIKRSEQLLRGYEIYELERIEKMTASESERIRIHNLIHDKTIQKLYSAGLLLENIKESASSNQLDYIRLSVNELNDCINDLRTVIYDERVDTNKSLIKLIEELINRFQIITSIKLSFKNELSIETESMCTSFQKSHCVWIIQEIIINAIKHSQGSFCNIVVSQSDGYVHIKGIDDGVGFSLLQKKSSKKYGLMSLQERTRALKGKFIINSKQGETIIWISIPV